MFVRVCKRLGDLLGDGEVLVCREPSRSDQAREGLTVDQLHHDEALTLGDPNAVDRADIGMVQAGSGPRLSE